MCVIIKTEIYSTQTGGGGLRCRRMADKTCPGDDYFVVIKLYACGLVINLFLS